MRDRFPFGNRGLVFLGNLSRRYLGIDKVDEVCVYMCVWGNSSKWGGRDHSSSSLDEDVY